MPKLFWTAAALALGLLASPAAAQVNAAKAEQACVGAAFKLLMIHRQTRSITPLRDNRGKVTGATLRMEVRFLGKPAEVTCIYDAATTRAVIELGNTPGAGVRPVPPSDVLRACTRAAQAQKLLVDNVVAETPIKTRQGQVTGRLVVFNVFQAGRPAQLHCSFDYATRETALALRRPQPR